MNASSPLRLYREWLAGEYSFADIAFYMAALFGERQGAVPGHRRPGCWPGANA